MKSYVVVGILAALALHALAAEESSPAPVASASTTSVGTKTNVLNYGNRLYNSSVSIFSTRHTGFALSTHSGPIRALFSTS